MLLKFYQRWQNIRNDLYYHRIGWLVEQVIYFITTQQVLGILYYLKMGRT